MRVCGCTSMRRRSREETGVYGHTMSKQCDALPVRVRPGHGDQLSVRQRRRGGSGTPSLTASRSVYRCTRTHSLHPPYTLVAEVAYLESILAVASMWFQGLNQATAVVADFDGRWRCIPCEAYFSTSSELKRGRRVRTCRHVSFRLLQSDSLAVLARWAGIRYHT